MKNKVIILLFAALIVSAQEINFIREINPFPVSEQGRSLNNVFSGGLNNPEFQFVDIDADDDGDLFIYSSDGKFVWYENTGDKSNPLFVYQTDSTVGLKIYDWFYFVDIDADGDFDCFTGNRGSKISYFENIGSAVSAMFELRIDTMRNIIGNDMISEVGSDPAFVDIDNDNDFDFFTGNSSGAAYFYENIGTPGEFEFDSLDSKWQDLQVGSAKIVINSRHGSSSVDFADIDADGDFDLFWGDRFNTSLYLIRNHGSAEIPDMSIESKKFPLNEDSISTRGHNFPRFFDIDSDGDLDLFSSVVFPDFTIKSTIFFYENNQGNLSLRTDDYINTLDVGARSVPSLIDIDGDQDLDLFIGSEDNPEGSIYFYENIGNTTTPEFELKTRNYFNISGELSLSPTFGDLDNDGDFDLLTADFFTGITYYENTGSEFSAQFVDRGLIEDSNSNELSPGSYAKIRLVDADKDGDFDLVGGNFKGEVKFYRNIGTAESFLFQDDSQYFEIELDNNYTHVNLVDYDSDGINELFVGSSTGKLSFFENNSNQNPAFDLINGKFFEYNFGLEPDVVFADIDDDGDNDALVGNLKGGLAFFRNQLISSVRNGKSVPNDYSIKIKSYPNPFNSIVHFEISVPKNLYYSLKIFNILGEEVLILKNGISTGEARVLTWNTNELQRRLASGVYLAVLQTEREIRSLPIQYLK